MPAFPNSPLDAVIVHACRTPLLRSQKDPSRAPEPAPFPPTLLSTVLQSCIQTIPASDIEEICVGNVLSPASGYTCFRMAAISTGIPSSVPLNVVNRQCGSGLHAVDCIANAISVGQIDVGVAGGVESMTYHKMTDVDPPAIDWEAIKPHPEAMDCSLPMGIMSENVVKEFGLTREEMDEFSYRSHVKAGAAQSRGDFLQEIVPVGNLDRDTGVRKNTSPQAMGRLLPSFAKDGSTTAGNSSQVTDGAAAVVLLSRREAERRRLPILGVWRGNRVVGVPPRIMGIGPAVAIPALLKKKGLTVEDIQIFEINEAFASQALYCIRTLGLDEDKVNPNGGAIALGHPLGCTGARLVVSILHEMRRQGHTLGVVSMCVGTGMGSAALLEVPTTSAKL